MLTVKLKMPCLCAPIITSSLAPSLAGGRDGDVTLTCSSCDERSRPCSVWNSGSCCSYVVTVVGLPLAIFTFWQEQRKERENEDEETYQLLSDAYTDFLKLVMENPDLQLRSRQAAPQLTDEQRERRQVVFEMLVSLFERAYLLAYDDPMTEKQRRRWHSWDDYMREWCRRPDFCTMLRQLLEARGCGFRRLHPTHRRRGSTRRTSIDGVNTELTR